MTTLGCRVVEQIRKAKPDLGDDLVAVHRTIRSREHGQDHQPQHLGLSVAHAVVYRRSLGAVNEKRAGLHCFRSE